MTQGYSLAGVAKRGPIAHATSMKKFLLAFLFMVASTAAAAAPTVPAGIARQLPAGYVVLSSVRMSVLRPARTFQIIALRRSGDDTRTRSQNAAARPLLIFELRGNNVILVGRNDTVILKADEAMQCDPFLDGGATISDKGRFFTVENGVACGQHWTDFITFRFDDRAGFVFHNERSESWSLNPSNDPNAEVLVRDGPQHVRRAKPDRITPFAEWRRER